MNAVKINSISELKEILGKNNFIVIKFYADWCGVCKHIKDNAEALFLRHSDIKFCEINCGNDQNNDLVNENFDGLDHIMNLFSIKSVPSFVFIKDIEKGRIIQTSLLGKIPLIQEKVNEFLKLNTFLVSSNAATSDTEI